MDLSPDEDHFQGRLLHQVSQLFDKNLSCQFFVNGRFACGRIAVSCGLECCNRVL